MGSGFHKIVTFSQYRAKPYLQRSTEDTHTAMPQYNNNKQCWGSFTEDL